MSLRFNLLLEQATLRYLLAICWLSVRCLFAGNGEVAQYHFF